jgi:predicted heme/steroid binding protein
MTASSASLMSVPLKRIPASASGKSTVSYLDYGLLLNPYELARYNGSTDELPILIAYRGRIFDVTGCKPWSGMDRWGHYAGRDCTAELRKHPRCDSLLTAMPCVGLLED